ncbi:MAG: hypothetical protein KDD56_10125, partial [Bdellovibrionales bacterium]|nr:hypothetical protein [Bdellovibrionales bacterium]
MKVKSLLNHPMFADSFGMAVGQVFIIGISFLISVVLARNLKVEDLGYYLLVNAYAGTAGFFSLPGMQIALTKGILKNY